VVSRTALAAPGDSGTGVCRWTPRDVARCRPPRACGSTSASCPVSFRSGRRAALALARRAARRAEALPDWHVPPRAALLFAHRVIQTVSEQPLLSSGHRPPAWRASRPSRLEASRRATLPPSSPHLRAAVCPGACRRGSQSRCAARPVVVACGAASHPERCRSRFAPCALRRSNMQHSRRLPGALLRRMRVPAALSPSVVASVRRRACSLAAARRARSPHARATRARCATAARPGAAAARASCGFSCSSCV